MGLTPPFRQFEPWLIRPATALSQRLVLRWIPCPVCIWWMRPERMALEAQRLVTTSTIAKPSLQGSPCFSPVRCMYPVQAWIRLSKAGQLALEPKSPKPETEQQTSCQLYCFNVSQSIFSFQVVPGMKFSMTASDCWTRRQSTSLHFCYLRFKERDRLFLLMDMKQADSWLCQGGPHDLVGSPYGGSILMTSQPKSARTMVAQGPAMIRERSMIFLPFMMLIYCRLDIYRFNLQKGGLNMKQRVEQSHRHQKKKEEGQKNKVSRCQAHNKQMLIQEDRKVRMPAILTSILPKLFPRELLLQLVSMSIRYFTALNLLSNSFFASGVERTPFVCFLERYVKRQRLIRSHVMHQKKQQLHSICYRVYSRFLCLGPGFGSMDSQKALWSTMSPIICSTLNAFIPRVSFPYLSQRKLSYFPSQRMILRTVTSSLQRPMSRVWGLKALMILMMELTSRKYLSLLAMMERWVLSVCSAWRALSVRPATESVQRKGVLIWVIKSCCQFIRQQSKAQLLLVMCNNPDNSQNKPFIRTIVMIDKSIVDI